MGIGVAFAEMVIAFGSPLTPLETGGPPLDSIQDVWKLALMIGLIAILISWTRGHLQIPAILISSTSSALELQELCRLSSRTLQQKKIGT